MTTSLHISKNEFDNMNSARNMPSMIEVTANFAAGLDAESSSIVYLPEGEHEISATVNGKPGKVKVVVDRDILAAFAEDLKQRQANNVRPFAGFDHKPGPASFVPLEFRYEDGVGLMLDVEWTKAGRESVEGNNYAGFSPSFLIGKDGRPAGLLPHGEVGSLTNDPAFTALPAVAAAHANPENHHTNTMTLVDTLAELGLVEANTDPETAVQAAKSKVAEIQAAAAAAAPKMDELEQLKAKYAKLEAEYADLKKKMKETVRASAVAIVEAAVNDGRIPAQADKAKEFWVERIAEDPAAAEVLASYPVLTINKQSVIDRSQKQQEEPEVTGIQRTIKALSKD